MKAVRGAQGADTQQRCLERLVVRGGQCRARRRIMSGHASPPPHAQAAHLAARKHVPHSSMQPQRWRRTARGVRCGSCWTEMRTWPLQGSATPSSCATRQDCCPPREVHRHFGPPAGGAAMRRGGSKPGSGSQPRLPHAPCPPAEPGISLDPHLSALANCIASGLPQPVVGSACAVDLKPFPRAVANAYRWASRAAGCCVRWTLACTATPATPWTSAPPSWTGRCRTWTACTASPTSGRR